MNSVVTDFHDGMAGFEKLFGPTNSSFWVNTNSGASEKDQQRVKNMNYKIQ